LSVILQVLRCQYNTFYVTTSYPTHTTYIQIKSLLRSTHTQHTLHILSQCFVLDNNSLHHPLFLWKICRAFNIQNACSKWEIVYQLPASISTFMQYPRQLTNSFTSLFICWKAVAEMLIFTPKAAKLQQLAHFIIVD
jgi:hypothetical protein